MPKNLPLDSSVLTTIKKKQVALSLVRSGARKSGLTQIANVQLGYQSASPIYFQRGLNSFTTWFG